KNHRKVFGGVCAELDCRSFRDVQVHVAFEVDRASQKCPGGNNYSTASRFVACSNCLLKSHCAIGFTITSRAVLCDYEIALSKDRSFYSLQYLWQLPPCVIRGKRISEIPG